MFATNGHPEPPVDAPVDDEHCRLLGPTALLVQGVMGIIVLLSLVYKRHREKPMRPWRIWLFDVSKQIAGQVVVHLLNIGISDLVSRPSSGNNPCTAYFVNVTFDVTIGVVIIWGVLHLAANILTKHFALSGFQSGQYGNPPSLKYWARQASVYIVAVIVMKLAVLALLALIPAMIDLGEWLLSWTGGDTRVQIVFVMGLYPIIMNVVQFWLIDSIVKASAFLESREIPDGPSTAADRQPLVSPDSDDSDTEDIAPIPGKVYDVESQDPKDITSSSSGISINRSRTTSSHTAVSDQPSPRRRTSSRAQLPSPINIHHDYPPPKSQRATPVGSPLPGTPFLPSVVKRRSPPPSPSPSATPIHYGSTADSPRMREPTPAAVAGWAWEGDKEPKQSATEDAKANVGVRGWSPRDTPIRKESWNLPIVSPTAPNVTLI